MKAQYRLILVVIAAMLIPSAGHVLADKPMRGLMMVFWMFAFGYITYQLSPPDVSFVGRYAGGFAVWALSVVDASRIAKRRFA